MFDWYEHLVEGREHVENESHDRLPRTSITAKNIRRVQLLESDRRLTIIKIPNEVGTSYVSTFSIITDELEFRKVFARWVSRILILEQKFNRLQV